MGQDSRRVRSLRRKQVKWVHDHWDEIKADRQKRRDEYRAAWREFFAAALNPACRSYLKLPLGSHRAGEAEPELRKSVSMAADIADAAFAESKRRGRA